nr:hypothetical protein [Syntrophaceae bacterium]
MAEKEESQFLQELESRLDSLFGEDTKTVRKDAALTSEAEAESPDIMPHHEEPESEKTADTDMEGEVGREIASETPEQEPSAAAEIDRRFSEIFGDNHKTSPPIQKTPSPQALPFEPPPSFDRLKSIILSLEWEISLEVLEQMENEIDDVYPCLNNHPTAQGLLKILRFVGRYLRVWQEKSDQDSVHLLLSVFDQLENLIFSKWMTESEKHQCLTESIQHYRYWVERVELENPPEEYLAEPSDTITLPPQESPVPEETTQASEPESQEPELQAEPEPLLAEADQEPLPPEPEDEQPSLQEPDRIEPEPSDTITLPPQESPVPEETTQASEPESQEPEPLLAEADQEPLPPEPEDEQPFLQEPDRIEPEPSDTITLPPQESPVPEETTQASEPESQEPELQAEQKPLLAEADQEPLPPEPEDEQPSLQEPDRIEPEPSDTITLPPQESPVPEETTQASEPESQEPELQ